MSFAFNSGGNDTTVIRLDGVTLHTESATNFTDVTTFDPYFGWFGGPGVSKILYIDDIAINDDQGASQTTWPGDGNIVCLVPTADSVRDALWTGGAGGTSNLFAAVDNKPPVGTATETDTTQIEHAGSAAGTTDDYEATMQTYTVGGVPAGATITLVQAVAAHGEDVTTGAKVLSIEVLSNPVIASAGNFTVGDASPALLATYPSEWGLRADTVSYAPSPTLGTAPVMRVRRPETAARVASVCFMGMQVEYVVAATPDTLVELRGRPYGLHGQQQMHQLLSR